MHGDLVQCNVRIDDGSWDGVRGPVNTREELQAYDVDMYNFLAKIYPETEAVSEAWANVPDNFHPSDEPQQPTWNTESDYKIKTVLNGSCMESNSNNSSAGAIIDLWWDFDGEAEYWRLIPDSNNEYYMIQLQSGNFHRIDADRFQCRGRRCIDPRRYGHGKRRTVVEDCPGGASGTVSPDE